MTQLAARCLLPALLLPGCVAWSRPAPVAPPEALLEDHVAELRKNAKENLGVLAPDLTFPEGYPPEAYSLGAGSDWTKAERTRLYFLGVTGDQICFSHMLVDRPADVTATDLLESTRADEGTWVAFVDSLDALKGPAWPAPPHAKLLDSVKLADDKVETLTRKEGVGDGDSINVSHDERHTTFKLCGPTPSQPASARFLVAVSHRFAPAPTPAWTEQAEADLGPKVRGAFARRANAVVVWALTADGAYDVYK